MSDQSPTKGIKEEYEVMRVDYFLSKLTDRGYTLSSKDCSYLINLLAQAYIKKKKMNI